LLRQNVSFFLFEYELLQVYALIHLHAEVGKVTFKSNSDEALNDEFLLKSSGDEALNDVFL
jgi:hypothetical protein